MPKGDQNSLKWRRDMGEVDPRTYPLVICVKPSTIQIGTTQRRHELNRLTRLLDQLAGECGEREVRIHYTRDPEVHPRDKVEVRVQPLTIPEKEEAEFITKMKAKRDHIAEFGASPKGGWSVVD